MRISTAAALFSSSDAWSAKRGSSRQFRAADGFAQGRPVLARLQAGEGQGAAVLGLVVPRQRIGGQPSGRGRGPRDVQHQREGDGLPHGPHPHSEERHVDDGRLAGTFTVEQGAEDSPRDGHGTDGVAEPGRRRDGDEVVFGPRGPGRHPRAGPESQRVVGPLVGVRSALALTRPAHVNDAGVLGPNLVHPDLQLRPHARELVGQEDVGRPRQRVEDLQTLSGGQVETQALLSPVRVLEQHVDVVGDERQTRRGQAAHGIAPLHVLDLDDLGPQSASRADAAGTNVCSATRPSPSGSSVPSERA